MWSEWTRSQSRRLFRVFLTWFSPSSAGRSLVIFFPFSSKRLKKGGRKYFEGPFQTICTAEAAKGAARNVGLYCGLNGGDERTTGA